MTNQKPIIVLQGLSSTMGVWFFRTKQFYDYIVKNTNHTDNYEFVLIDRPFKEDDLPLLEKAALTHVHRVVQAEGNNYMPYLRAIKSNAGKLVVDNDDYWLLNSQHPAYNPQNNKVAMEEITSLMAYADHVTVASDELKKMSLKYNPNISVQYNCFNTELEQFQNKRIPYRDGIPTVGYVGGSSHKHDFTLLEEAFKGNKSDFRVLLAGWDTRGGNHELSVNEELVKELGANFTQQVFEQIKRTEGNVDQIDGLSPELKEKYRDKVILVRFVPIQPHQTPYFYYEQVMTDNWKNVGEETQQLLFDNFTTKIDIERPEITRIWTKDVNQYCNAYDLMDIALAPLMESTFNKGKSALKLIEAGSRALPVICSKIAPYTEIGRHLENCYMVEPDSLLKKCQKKWAKAINYMVKNRDHAVAMGLQLQKDVKEKYDIERIITERIRIYDNLIGKKKQDDGCTNSDCNTTDAGQNGQHKCECNNGGVLCDTPTIN